jgi:hypothetical protein
MGESKQLAGTLSAIISDIGRCNDALVSGRGSGDGIAGRILGRGERRIRRQTVDASSRSLEPYDDWRSHVSDADPAPPENDALSWPHRAGSSWPQHVTDSGRTVIGSAGGNGR